MAKPYTPIFDWPIKDRPNPTAKIPYAYKEDPENPLKLIPDMELLPFVERALQYINEGNTVRSVAEWLSQAAKKTITHQGIDYIWEQKCGSDPHNPIVKERRRRRREKAPKTPEEKERYYRQKELNKAAQKVGRERKKLAAIDAKIAEQERLAQIEPEEIVYPSFDEAPVIPKELENREIAFTPNPGPQTEFLAAPEREVLYGGAAGGGKALELSFKINTLAGPKTMGSISVGDYVYGQDGKPTKVIWKSPVYTDHSCYKVTFDTNETVIVDAGHLWLTQTTSDRDGKTRTPLGTIKTTETIYQTLLTGSKARRINHSVPIAAPLNQEQIELPIAPYLFGLWLGDGFSKSGAIGMDLADFLEIARYIPKHKHEKIREPNLKTTYSRFSMRSYSELNRTRLKEIGVYKHKHIPEIYFHGSYTQRLDLLNGIMDTDGTCSKDSKLSITLKSKELCFDVYRLINSLGIKCHEPRSKIRKIKSIGFESLYWHIGFCTSVPVFKLERKLSRMQTISRQTQFHRYIVSVEPCEPIPVQCIQVDNAEHMYLIGDAYIPTHNSYALLADPMRYFDHPSFRGLILRRTNDELRELKWKSKELYSKTFPDAKWKEQMSMWVFPSGAELWMTYLERDDDVLRYQGQAFSYIAIDELTQYATPFAWDYMRSRLRTTAPDLPIFMRATSNPGGPGHLWVKKMFVDPAVPGQAFNATDIETGEVLKYPDNHHDRKLRGLPLFQRRFIPAKLADNPYLMKGGEYEANLLSLPEAQKRKLLDGDWSIIEGAAFPEFSTSTHVITPYKIPSSWRKFRSADFGYSSFSAVHWFAIDPVYETLIVYRELYVSKCTAIELAQRIKQIEAEAGENVMYGVLDSSTWHQRGHNGPSIAEEMIGQGVSWRPSDRTKGSRTAGFNRLHELLKTTPYSDGKKVPGIVFFNNCRQIIADLQVIPVHPDGVDDIDDKYLSDHTYDSIRYGIMSRPRGQSPWDFEVTSISASHSPVDRVFGY